MVSGSRGPAGTRVPGHAARALSSAHAAVTDLTMADSTAQETGHRHRTVTHRDAQVVSSILC